MHSVMLGVSSAQVSFRAVLVNGIVAIFPSLPQALEMNYFAKLEILGSYKNKCKPETSSIRFSSSLETEFDEAPSLYEVR